MEKVTMKELTGAKIVLAVCIAVYYWCWARNDWHQYYSTITVFVGIFAALFFMALALRERKFKEEIADEMVVTNIRRCDSICLKIAVAAILIIGFLCAFLRFTVSTEVIGYMLMALLVGLSVIKTVLFCIMDNTGI